MGKPVNSTLVKEIMALEVYTAVRHLSRYAPGDVYHPATVRGGWGRLWSPISHLSHPEISS